MKNGSRVSSVCSAVAVAAAVLAIPTKARADVTLVEKDGWTFYTRGLVAAHYQLVKGDADPDHKKLRTHVVDGVLRHVNNGYCSLLEPKQISGSQFAEWIAGRNPGTYVAVHYVKLIDFTFGPAWRLTRIADISSMRRGTLHEPSDTVR